VFFFGVCCCLLVAAWTDVAMESLPCSGGSERLPCSGVSERVIATLTDVADDAERSAVVADVSTRGHSTVLGGLEV
jgi:hypothetical protein